MWYSCQNCCFTFSLCFLQQNQTTVLMKASQAGLVDIVEMLLDHHANHPSSGKTMNTSFLTAFNKVFVEYFSLFCIF